MATRLALIVVDGAGLAPSAPGNGVTRQTLPTLFDIMDRYGSAVLEASGPGVGLDPGQVGNSEVGHLTIGLGRVVPSALARLDAAFADGRWAEHALWQEIASSPRLHIVGLLSDAGVHAHWRTMANAATVARAAGIADIVVHPMLDGVDSQAGTAPRLLADLKDALPDDGVRLGVIMGRKWFCDRSGDETITKVFADALEGRAGDLPEFSDDRLAAHLADATEASFGAHLAPGGVTIDQGEPVIHASHRADRAVQAATALGETGPVYAMVTLGKGEGVVPESRTFFPTRAHDRGLAFTLAEHGIKPIRIAESCKFPHVTYFMNGFNRSLGESQFEIPSPSEPLDERPEMATEAVADTIIGAMVNPATTSIFANIANLDQVGHLGSVPCIERAADAVDAALRRIVETAGTYGWTVVLTADHGNADRVLDDQGRPFGSHTDAPVPFTVIPAAGLDWGWSQQNGSLANIAATLLTLMGVPVPEDMEPSLVTVRGMARAAE